MNFTTQTQQLRLLLLHSIFWCFVGFCGFFDVLFFDFGGFCWVLWIFGFWFVVVVVACLIWIIQQHPENNLYLVSASVPRQIFSVSQNQPPTSSKCYKTAKHFLLWAIGGLDLCRLVLLVIDLYVLCVRVCKLTY